MTPKTPKPEKKQFTLPEPVRAWQRVFNRLDNEPVRIIEEIYTRDVEFRDPARTLRGIDELKDYMRGQYEGVIHCRFEWRDIIIQDQRAAVEWVMKLRHRKLRGGGLIKVPGNSLLHFNEERITKHVDYFDLGKMLYENVPVLGSAVKTLKKRL